MDRLDSTLLQLALYFDQLRTSLVGENIFRDLSLVSLSLVFRAETTAISSSRHTSGRTSRCYIGQGSPNGGQILSAGPQTREQPMIILYVVVYHFRSLLVFTRTCVISTAHEQ